MQRISLVTLFNKHYFIIINGICISSSISIPTHNLWFLQIWLCNRMFVQKQYSNRTVVLMFLGFYFLDISTTSLLSIPIQGRYTGSVTALSVTRRLSSVWLATRPTATSDKAKGVFQCNSLGNFHHKSSHNNCKVFLWTILINCKLYFGKGYYVKLHARLYCDRIFVRQAFSFAFSLVYG